MKRAYPKEVKPVSPKDAEVAAFVSFDAGNSGVPRQASLEGKKAAGTKAAVIGLAISMGASSLFLPRQGDRAWATEPIKANTTATAAVSGGIEAAKAASFGEGESSPLQDAAVMPNLPGVENSAHKEQTLLPAATAQLELPNVASSFNVSAEKVRQVDSAVSPTAIAELEIAPRISTFEQQFAPSNQASLPMLQMPQTKTLNLETPIAGEVNELFSAKQEVLKANQDVALQQLQQATKRLKSLRAEWGSEEFSSSLEAELPARPLNASSSLPSLTLPVVAQRDNAIGLPVYGSNLAAQMAAPLISPPNVSTFSSVVPVQALPNQVGTKVLSFTPVDSAPSVRVAPETATPAPKVVEESLTPKPSRFPVAPSAYPEARVSLPEVPEEGQVEKVTVPDLSQTVTIVTKGTEAVVIDTDQASQAQAKTYRVNPGDTVDAISRNYGIAQTELVKINQLRDPNTIKVDQTLQIPVEDERASWQPALTVRPKAKQTQVLNSSVEKASVAVPNLVLSQTDSASTAPSLPVVSLPTRADQSSVVVDNFRPTTEEVSPVADVANEMSGDAATVSSPYVERLRAEINKIRSKARANKGTMAQTDTSNAPGTANAIQPVYPSVLNAAPVEPVAPSAINPYLPNRHVNPEFDPNRSTRALQANGEQPRQIYQGQTTTASNAEVEPINASLPTGTRNNEPPVVATAPIGADAYNQIQPRMVSPELPPLSAPDTYLPKGGTVFTGFIWPAKGELTSGYGWRWGRMHAGIDVAAPVGTPVVAAAPGVVTYAQWNDGGYGNLVEVTHPDGSITLYGHNDRILVREGQQVEQGQQVAEMGSTGFSTGPHVHFEVHPRGQGAVDPMAFLPR